MEARAGMWHRDELSDLRSFIEEQQQWLDPVLGALGWSKERLIDGKTHLMQCPYNQHHFVDKTSLKKHKLKCRYGAVGVVPDDEVEISGSTFVSISSSIIEAIKKYALSSGKSSVVDTVDFAKPRRDYIDQSDVVVESHDKVLSLESRAATPQDILAQGPLHILRYIKAWRLVPSDFHQISSTTLNPVEVKAWLFTNLPSNHIYSSQLGGEIQAVECVMKALTSHHTLTPDVIATRLTPIFSQQCRSFVLRLWKSLHSAALQKQHTILDTVATELTPLPAAAVLFLEVDEKTSGDGVVMSDSFADKIQAIAAEDECPTSPLPPLPMEHVPFILNPLERKLLYDYVVEVGGSVPGSHSMDPSLFRDDTAATRAKLKRQAREESERTASEVSGEKVKGREMNLHQLKRERDYRRRRQKYRARNVHITRRTPAQVMRDIINARMLEISGGSLPETIEESASLANVDPSTSKTDRDNKVRAPLVEAESSGAKYGHGSRERDKFDECKSDRSDSRRSQRSKSRERSRRLRSRERSRRSKSRERSRRSKSKERSRRSKSRERLRRSRSRERSSRRKSRSASREKRKDHHKKKSRDKEKKSSHTAEAVSVRDKHRHSSRSGEKRKHDRHGSGEKDETK